MHTIDGTRDLLLERDEFFIQLDSDWPGDPALAPAFLGRRRVTGRATLVGSAEMQPDGHWRASVAADPTVRPEGYVRVAHDVDHRHVAVVALWHARVHAYDGSTSL